MVFLVHKDHVIMFQSKRKNNFLTPSAKTAKEMFAKYIS